MNITYKSNNNVVYSCKYHVVWCPKYRRKILTNGIDTRLKELLLEYAANISVDIMEMEIMLEMVATIVHQLTRGLSPEEIQKAGFAPYYVDHTIGIWPQAAGGIPFNACEFQSKGDAITDLFEDMAAEGAIV